MLRMLAVDVKERRGIDENMIPETTLARFERFK